MSKQKYDKLENKRKRLVAHRKRMREKGLVYRCFWVPDDEKAKEKLSIFLDKLVAEYLCSVSSSR